MRNMFDFTMQLLDSRASRMSPNQTLLTLHAGYIGGQHANYRTWYFATQLNLDDAVGQSQNLGLQRLKSVKGGGAGKSNHLDSALNRWRNAMNNKVYALHNQAFPSAPMTWSATALSGAVATLIMIFATIFEFVYIPTTWNNASHLTTRLLFLCVILVLTAGPTFYIATVDGRPGAQQIPLIFGIVQFFISVPSGRMFGDRVVGKSCKYIASQTFTASYPALARSARTASILLWLLVFGCNFTQSYVHHRVARMR